MKNIPRLFISAVVLMNLQSAVQFLTRPEIYAPHFELVGLPGETAIRGFGVLFTMWSVPYLVAAWNPYRHRTALYESIAMQTIGLVGETIIQYSLPTHHTVLQNSIQRFVIFDTLGLFVLSVAAILVVRQVRE